MIYSMIELIPIVKRLTEKYTSKESTSVTYEVAEQLMAAVIYCINEYHETIGYSNIYTDKEPTDGNLHSTDLSVNDDTRSELDEYEIISAVEAYEKGYQAVIAKVMRAKALYEDIVTDFLWYGNRALYETINKGMPEFFIRYDARFNPQDHLLTLDYPILKSLHDRCGIDAIYDYLGCIKMEQVFLAGFSREIVGAALNHYHPDHKGLFLNLAGVVINYALDKMLADHPDPETYEGKDRRRKKRLALDMLIKERFHGRQDIVIYLQHEL